MRNANNSLEMFYILLASYVFYFSFHAVIFFLKTSPLGEREVKSLGASSHRQPSIPLSVLKSFLKSTDLCKGKVRGRAGVAGGQKGFSLVFPNPSLPKA